MSHDDLCKQAMDAVRAVFNDTSVPQTTTDESLLELRDEIDIMRSTLEV